MNNVSFLQSSADRRACTHIFLNIHTRTRTHIEVLVGDEYDFTFGFDHLAKTFCTFCMTFYGCGIFGTILNKSDQTNSTIHIKVRKERRIYPCLQMHVSRA